MMDKRCFEITILPLYRRVYAMCLAVLGDGSEAADAVQQTYSILWERRESLDNVESPEAYVRTVARNVCLRRVKSRLRTESLSEVGESAVSDDSNTEVNSELAYLRSLIDGLPPAQSRVMKLSVFGNFSNDEIAGLTGESPDNVRQLLSRARKKIKELYNRRNQKS